MGDYHFEIMGVPLIRRVGLCLPLLPLSVVPVRVLLGVLVDGQTRVDGVVLPAQVGAPKTVDVRVVVQNRNRDVAL